MKIVIGYECQRHASHMLRHTLYHTFSLNLAHTFFDSSLGPTVQRFNIGRFMMIMS